jgi:hypothetical protein
VCGVENEAGEVGRVVAGAANFALSRFLTCSKGDTTGDCVAMS